MVDLSEMSGLSENGRFVRIFRKNHAIIILRASAIRIVSFPSAGITAQVSCYLCSMGPSAPSASSPSGAYHSFEVSTVDTFFFCRSETPGGFFIPPGSAKHPLPQKDLPPPGMTRRGKGSRSFEDHRTARQQKEAAPLLLTKQKAAPGGGCGGGHLSL